mmetsp:Transcript_18978/g.32432  ORF Transcript_18978/g.32432 Transcript_18978/m.32432 type:complete len:98 (-) Transcript_18978:309-602(-)
MMTRNSQQADLQARTVGLMNKKMSQANNDPQNSSSVFHKLQPKLEQIKLRQAKSVVRGSMMNTQATIGRSYLGNDAPPKTEHLFKRNNGFNSITTRN